MNDTENLEQNSYLVGYDAGERAAEFRLKILSFLVGVLIGAVVAFYFVRPV